MSLKSRIASLFGLGQQPQTQEYVAWPTGMWHVHAQQQRPIFNAYWADLMQFDHQVAFGLSICNAPVLKARVEVKSKSREIGQFVEKQWKKIWAQDAVRVLHAKCYGAMGYEVCYEVCDGRIEFLSLLDRHPRDTYPLVGKPGTPWAGRVVGLRIRSLKSPTDSTGIPPLARPKCLWLTYDAQHGSRWGRAILERAFGAWYERSGEGGAVEKRKLRMMKDAWVGDVMKYPLGGPFASIKLPNGTAVPASELAREAIENRMSGAVMALPSDTDEKGKPYFDYTAPTSVQGVSPILEYIKELDYDIFDGLGLPREVVEAASTGSGFSGRSIPFVAFLATRDIEFADGVRQIKSQIIDPMIVADFGPDAVKEFELVPVPLLETIGEMMGPMGQPDTMTSHPQQPPQMPEGDGEPMQFAMDFDESKHPRANDGKFSKGGGGPKKAGGKQSQTRTELVAALKLGHQPTSVLSMAFGNISGLLRELHAEGVIEKHRNGWRLIGQRPVEYQSATAQPAQAPAASPEPSPKYAGGLPDFAVPPSDGDYWGEVIAASVRDPRNITHEEWRKLGSVYSHLQSGEDDELRTAMDVAVAIATNAGRLRTGPVGTSRSARAADRRAARYLQFASDFDETDHPRNDDGTFKKKLADAYQMHRRYDWKSIYEDAAGENVTLADDLWNRFEGDTDRMDRLARKLAKESGYAGKYDGWEHSKEHAAELVEASKNMPVEEVAALDKEAAEMLIAGKKPGQIVSHYLQRGEAHKVLRLPSILGPYRRNYAFTERIKREMPIEKPIEQDGDKALASLSDDDIASIQESDPAGTHHPFYAAAEHVLQSVPLSIDWKKGYRDGLGFELAKGAKKEAKRAVMGLWKQLPEDQQDETYGAQADADTVLESILSRHVAAANKAGERTDTAALSGEVLGMLRDGKSEAEIVDAIAASDQPWRVLALGDVYDSAKSDYEQELEDRKQAEEDAAAEAAEEVEEEPEEEPEDEPEDDEETIQFALDDRPQTGSLPQKTESLAEKAARQQADRLRRSLRQLAEKTKADGGSLIAEVDGLLREFEPQLAEGIYYQWLAGWLGGAEEALSGVPEMEQTGEPIRLPPIPPVAPPLIGNMGDDGEIVFPALDRALKSLANKRAVTRETFDAMTAQAREHAFTVAGGLRESAVEKIRDLLTKEIEEGPSLKGFADRVSSAFGRSPLGASHLETVYRAALSSSYSRGVESVLSLPMVEDEFPYRLYVPIHDARARDEHTKLEKLGLDGTAVYHRDDPTWKKFQPPWDYGCRCGWIALTIQDASRRGVKHAKQWLENIREAKAKGTYNGQAISQMPPVEFVEPPPFEPSPDWRR